MLSGVLRLIVFLFIEVICCFLFDLGLLSCVVVIIILFFIFYFEGFFDNVNDVDLVFGEIVRDVYVNFFCLDILILFKLISFFLNWFLLFCRFNGFLFMKRILVLRFVVIGLIDDFINNFELMFFIIVLIFNLVILFDENIKLFFSWIVFICFEIIWLIIIVVFWGMKIFVFWVGIFKFYVVGLVYWLDWFVVCVILVKGIMLKGEFIWVIRYCGFMLIIKLSINFNVSFIVFILNYREWYSIRVVVDLKYCFFG